MFGYITTAISDSDTHFVEVKVAAVELKELYQQNGQVSVRVVGVVSGVHLQIQPADKSVVVGTEDFWLHAVIEIDCLVSQPDALRQLGAGWLSYSGTQVF